MDIQGLLDFLDPVVLKDRLARVSMFIAVYESFRDTIIQNVKYFYWSGFGDGKEFFRDYERRVLSKPTSRKGRTLKGTLLWLVEVGAMSEEDAHHFDSMTDMRNRLAHDMLTVLWEGLPEGMEQLHVTMLELYTKTVRWWFREIEAPTNPDLTSEQYENISWESVTTPALVVLDFITKIALADQNTKPEAQE